MNQLSQKLDNLPKLPGVYFFKNKNGDVIYVGKAKNLKSRVTQYFSGRDGRGQIPFLMEEAADLDYTVASNELESLFLESTLVRKFLPKYNIMLRDDKNYAFIKIDYNFQIPQIQIVRKIDQTGNFKFLSAGRRTNFKKNLKSKILNPKSKYFGPYSAAYKIRNTLNLTRRIFPYCSANEVSGRPCFYYYLHRCPGVCVGKISLEEYSRQLSRIENFLAGNTGKIKKELEAEMKTASAGQEFEKAARLRDQCEALALLEEKQIAILPKKVDWDIVSAFSDQGYACVNLFKVRGGKLFDKENFVYELSNPDLLMIRQLADGSADTYGYETIQTFLEQYYLETSSVPKVIYTQTAAENSDLIEHIVKSRFDKKIKVLVPQKGKPAALVKLGTANAREYLNKWLSDRAGHLDKINDALAQLKEALNLKKIPERMECYDISNIQGTNAVGSMVVFEKGLPKKSDYRKFKIKTKQTPDDFVMMREMLTRRFARLQSGGKSEIRISKSETNLKSEILNLKSSWPKPDLIVIDGGKGQLGVAVEVLEKYHLNIPVIGLAKRIEEIFVLEKPEPIILAHDQPALQLLQRLRDEAHRFGITFHRNIRSKQATKSALDGIPGIGPKTKKLLKYKFGTVANIRKTSLDDLAKIVGERIAQLIQQSL